MELPYLTYDDLKDRVRVVVEKWPRLKEVPVPIPEFVEFDLKLSVIAIPGLKERFNVEGFLSIDRKSITITGDLFERYYNRYRFTLAHELGHYYLHKNIFDALENFKMESYKEFYKTHFGEKKYSILEGQAYDFAGVLLVPIESLVSAIDEAKAMILSDSNSDDVEWASVDEDIIKNHMCKYIGRKFHVSGAVIERRIQRENLSYLP